MGYIKGKGIRLQEEIIKDATEYRQSMLDFFKREGGATFGQMHLAIDKDVSAPRINYHFYELKDNGYIKEVGLHKVPGTRACKLWKAIKDVYVYPKVREIKKKSTDEKAVKPAYVSGVMVVGMRHVPRVPTRTGKVHIGSTMGMF